MADVVFAKVSVTCAIASAICSSTVSLTFPMVSQAQW